ncbi:MAG: hypothetical protein C0421_04705 [Hyphomonas sp.]|uniref:hypothetical protein n=1 Tax=Hyphomonas sp. TaxID=87 RepID=UPI0025C39834|nr:hypothetical protein [Hyphomonas sp.]MBA4338126.1 hypothetical protein [Hyphomonas sp.]
MRFLVAASAMALCAISASATPVEGSGAADKKAANWELRPFTVYDRNDIDKPVQERRISYSGVIVHTADISQPGALLTCSEKFGLSVMFSLKPVDFSDEDYFASSRQARTFNGSLSVEGEPPKLPSRFVVRRKLGVVQSVGSEEAYTAVDALYAGQSMTLEVPGFDPVNIDLPPPDSSLRAFVADCPAFAKS